MSTKRLDVRPPGPATETELRRAREFIAKVTWSFAKTMPHAPHEYTVRSKDPGQAAEFEYFVAMIRELGYTADYGRSRFTYMDLDGWKYWTMGAPLPITTIINREKLYEEKDRTSPD